MNQALTKSHAAFNFFSYKNKPSLLILNEI